MSCLLISSASASVVDVVDRLPDPGYYAALRPDSGFYGEKHWKHASAHIVSLNCLTPRWTAAGLNKAWFNKAAALTAFGPQRGELALHAAAVNGKTEVLKVLLEAGGREQLFSRNMVRCDFSPCRRFLIGRYICLGYPKRFLIT